MDGCSCCLSMTRPTRGNCCVSCCAARLAHCRHSRERSRSLPGDQAEPPDIVFTDWQMPGESGLDLIRYIRERPDSPDPLLPVILLTANGDADMCSAHGKPERRISGQAVLSEPHLDRVTRGSPTAGVHRLLRLQGPRLATRRSPGRRRKPSSISCRPVPSCCRRMVCCWRRSEASRGPFATPCNAAPRRSPSSGASASRTLGL